MNSFVVYVDESGDEGLDFTKLGTSEWFVLACAITRRSTDLQTVQLVERVKTRIRWQKNQQQRLHFRRMREDDRLLLLDEIASAELKAITVLIHKPSITNTIAFKEKNVLYHYTARYLLERVSWCCRDWYREDRTGDGSAEVHFSNRAQLSMEDVRQYLYRIKGNPNNRVEWSVIKPEQCLELATGREMGQQIADAIASAFFFSARSSSEKKTASLIPPYAERLAPIMYRHGNVCARYGIKFFPNDYLPVIQSDEQWAWLRDVYQFGA
jgi:hypothetical protein